MPSPHNSSPYHFIENSSGEDLLDRPYSEEELNMTEEQKIKLKNLMKFFDENGIEYDKFDPESIPKLDLSKRKAYPNQDIYMYIPGQHDTSKWLQAVREIYFKEKNGSNRVDAIRRITSGWETNETFDFLNWLRFHETGDHAKYKFAQAWYENPNIPGYILQIKPDPVKNIEPSVQGKDIDFARDDSERKHTIEKQRSKIIGRLDSAEKLLRSPDGQIFSGKEFEALLEAVYQLKRKIHMVNKVSTSTRLYEDMIIREANVLRKGGFIKAANVLYSVGQATAPTATPPNPPTTPEGAPGGLPASAPGVPAPPSLPEEDPQPLGIKQFLEGINTGKFTDPEDDKNKSEDLLEVEDFIDINENNDIIITEAQALDDVPMTSSPAPSPLDPSPVSSPKTPKQVKAPTPALEPLEVTEDDIKSGEEPVVPTSDFDEKVNAVLANITVADVVAKLEDLAKFYKTREAPRQLGIVDMMLDSLGLASYFPSLAEATNKSLESNNYISTRVEDILSKLRGAMEGSNTDFGGGEEPNRPEVAGIKNKLKSDDEKEQNRKQLRKDQEAADLASPAKETPNIEIGEDLAQPSAPLKPANPLP